MKAEKLSDLPDALEAACMVAVRKHGAATGREIQRHLLAMIEGPLTEHSAKLIHRLYERIERHLVDGQ